jgi:hypothetical protein
MEVQLHVLLTSAQIGGEWLISRSLRFTPGKEFKYITKLIVYIHISVNAPVKGNSLLR